MGKVCHIGMENGKGKREWKKSPASESTEKGSELYAKA
jgi:hypothetical protein